MKYQFNRVYQLLIDKIQSWIDAVITMLPNLVVAVFLFVIFNMINEMGLGKAPD